MLDVIASAFATMTMLLAVVCKPPARATCPPDVRLMRVYRSAAYVCTRVPVADDVRVLPMVSCADHSVVPAEIDVAHLLHERQEPIVVDARTQSQQRH